MIPDRVPEETRSYAERQLFYRFQEMEDTDDWTIIHSVKIANHPSQAQGEADFVAVIPGCGVFSLEVKGGNISYHNGQWQSSNKDGQFDIKDPVHEANEASHAFNDYVRLKTSAIDPASRCLFGFGVVFPDSYVRESLSIPDLDKAQIADKSDFYGMKEYLLGLAKFWKERATYNIELPDPSVCKKIVQLLRPDFDSHIPITSQIASVERQSITLTENQQFIFEGLRDNERCLVRGGAGTGKTLLAINLARDLANENNNTAFFCYNTKLADYLKDNTAGDDLGYCGSMTEYMIEVLQIYTSGGSFSLDEFPDKDKFYRETLPEMFSECFIENELPQFDYLIIDEAQDLMTENYLEVLDIILAGGLAGGNWCLFMDAGRQNIFHAGMTYEDIKKLLKDRRVFFARFELKDNCRNSISIIKEIDNIFGTTTRYPAVDEKGAPVVKKIYKKDKDQAKLITETLNSLIADGVRPELITVLSPYRYKNSVISSVSADISVSEVRETGSVFFSTIDSFKGLENSVIIITDIDTFFNDKNLSRLYIGMTRARSALYLLVSETANKNLSKIRKMTKK